MSPIWAKSCMPHSPLACLHELSLSPPSASDKSADRERLAGELAAAGFQGVRIPLDVLRKIPGELRKNRFELQLIMVRAKEGWDLIDTGEGAVYGLALDIGSTNIELSLFDLVRGRKVSNDVIENPQVRFGPDVLTRVQRSMTGEFDLISAVLLDSINGYIATKCKVLGVARERIAAVTVAGNTIESHFFLGLDVRNLPVSPYVPVFNKALYAKAGEAGLAINANALVYVFPNAGSYVGGDIISGILSSGIYKEERPCLFIDVGTNVEITLGCGEWIMTGAGAAGPALEGDIAGIGKRAEEGTISGVRIDRHTKRAELQVIGGGEPSGICGSGLIDLVSEMFAAGVIDASGLLQCGAGCEGPVVALNGERAYVVYTSPERKLFITQAEIRNFMLSKAAMFSSLYVFVKSVGLTFKDIERVYVAGALGCGINIESAVNIGMLPDIPREKFLLLGNSAIKGAEMMLMDRELPETVDAIAAKITYREMNEDPELMQVLQGAMFLPHTEPDLLKG